MMTPAQRETLIAALAGVLARALHPAAAAAESGPGIYVRELRKALGYEDGMTIAEIASALAVMLAPEPQLAAPVHVRITQGRELIADLPAWPHAIPQRGDYLFHPPFGDQAVTPDTGTGIAGCVKTVTWRTHDRPEDPDATAFTQTARPYVELHI